MRSVLMFACSVGLLLSAASFVMLTAAPRTAEQQVRAAAIALMRRELGERFGVPSAEVEIAEGLRSDLAQRLAGAREMLEGRAPEQLGALFAQLCRYDCAAPEIHAERIRASLRERVRSFEQGLDRVESWVRSRYASMIEACVRELRIFTGSNALLLLLGLVGLLKARDDSKVQVVAALLVVATFGVAFFYLSGQNWLLTLVLSDYVGWAYLSWVAAVFTLLVDWVFLRGVLTHCLLNVLAAPFSVFA